MPLEVTEPHVVPARSARPITGRFVLVAFISFFVVIALVNAVMMTLAIRTMPGLDVKNGYVASQAMNGEIMAMRQQSERGWKADIAVELKGAEAPVSLFLVDRSGVPVTGLEAKARLAHPALTRADHNASLIEERPGKYVTQFADIPPGAWTLIVEAGRNGERLFVSRNRVVLTEGRP
ncbi:MAG: FixH family protein [Beijerinckiaceae bacterium]